MKDNRELDWSLFSDDIKAVLASKAAEMWVEGIGEIEISETLSKDYNLPVTRARVAVLTKHPKYVDTLCKHIENGDLRLRAQAIKHSAKIVNTLVKSMDGGNEAARVRAAVALADIVGDRKTEEKNQQAQVIQIIPAMDYKKE